MPAKERLFPCHYGGWLSDIVVRLGRIARHAPVIRRPGREHDERNVLFAPELILAPSFIANPVFVHGVTARDSRARPRPLPEYDIEPRAGMVCGWGFARFTFDCLVDPDMAI